MSYQDYYNQQLQESSEYEDLVCDTLSEKLGMVLRTYKSKKSQYENGENKAGFEIKYDKRFKETGNLYIEVAEKANPENKNYVASGIFRDDNTWVYVIGDKETIFIFTKRILKALKDKFQHKVTPTSMGFIISEEQARRYAEIVLKV